MLLDTLPALKREHNADFCIVNGENAAIGNGIDRRSMEEIFAAGADVITGGNHSFQKRDSAEVLEEMPYVLRPANLGNTFGRGWCRVETLDHSILVINLQGMLYLPDIDNPFVAVTDIINEVARKEDIIVVDFHAEATSEKRAMGYHLDGKASLVFGTHTHIPTADADILPHGTGYITDIGMTGVKDSILGKAIAPAVHNFIHWGDADARQKTQDAHGTTMLSGIVAEIDEQTKKCTKINNFIIK